MFYTLNMVTHSHVLEVLNYDPATGVFIWRNDWGRMKAGDIAGRVNAQRRGYRYIGLGGQRKNGGLEYMAHRLAWFYVHGKWPVADIDHINGDTSDNRIANLREATRSQNIMNAKRGPRNTSGVKGVSFDKARGKWVAEIKAGTVRRRLGRFDTKDEAAAAYREASKEMHGEFARLE